MKDFREATDKVLKEHEVTFLKLRIAELEEEVEQQKQAVNYYMAQQLKEHNEYEKLTRSLEHRAAKYREALEKIADPRKRDHKEPDTYTQLCCVMHMAEEALEFE